MVPHLRNGEPLTSAPQTWRSWRSAWVDAAYAPDGFWSTEQPGDHFTTAVGVGPLVAQAVVGLVPEGVRALVDVGAGDGRLLTALVGLVDLGELVPDVTLVGVDRRPRPARLDPRIRWVVDHWDVEAGRWTGGGPAAWAAGVPLYVAHEWLDDLPVPVVEQHAGAWREVEVDGSGRERRGAAVGDADRAWLARWWATGGRAEVGRARDVAWAALVRAATARGGRALAVDYGHLAARRPADGSFAAYGRGRRRTPVADGSVNLTAGVAVDALAQAGATVGAATLLRERQADVLGRVQLGAKVEPLDGMDPLRSLVRRSERAAVTDPARWGDLWWLLQGAGPRRST
jgi:SAM-dependent MidA family methyltransferase